MTTYTAASFFTGVAGLDLAAEAAGFAVTTMCETNPHCRRVLRRHYPHVTLLGDIRHVTASHIGAVDCIFGGFPCQDLSHAGGGAGISGHRSGLWFELLRIIGDTRPRVVVLENVSAILVRGGTTVTAGLAAIGYDGVWPAVRAADVGAPHPRDRWFYVGASVDHPHRVRREGADARSVHPSGVGPDRTGQPLPQRPAPQSARHGSRRRHRGLPQPGLGRDAHGLPGRVDLSAHQFPAGSWLPQAPGEPPRLTEDAPGRAARVAALGNAVVPQQALPFFQAAHDYLTLQEATQ